MFLQIDPLTPPKRLALAYAKGQNRDILALLLLHDVKLSQIVKNGKEPLIGQMRMQWWRDVIAKPADQRPSGEPLLAALGDVEAAGQGSDVPAAMLKIVDAWDMLLANADWTEDLLADHAEARANAIFGSFAALTQTDQRHFNAAQKAGQYWALADLAANCQTQPQYDAVLVKMAGELGKYRLPKALRPLSILAFSISHQNRTMTSGMRLILHALTGH